MKPNSKGGRDSSSNCHIQRFEFSLSSYCVYDICKVWTAAKEPWLDFWLSNLLLSSRWINKVVYGSQQTKLWQKVELETSNFWLIYNNNNEEGKFHINIAFDVSNLGPKASSSFVNRYSNIFCLQINASRQLE